MAAGRAPMGSSKSMQVPLEITFRNLGRSEAIEAAARERALELERFVPEIVSCRVTIEAPHRRKRKGKLYRVLVDVRVPGAEIVAGRDPDKDQSHEDVYVAMRDAFDAARRQLEDRIRIVRGKVKTREGPPRGTIEVLHPDRDFGRITTPEGRLIYFHRNSVVNADFDDLCVGDEVRFNEEDGDDGPQASSVHLVAKRGAPG